MVLPGAPLGVYISYFLAGGNSPNVAGAITGIQAQQKLHEVFNPMQSNDTFALLQELGNTLQVNIPDLLNRSSDRPSTLTTYSEALKNITARSKMMSADLDTSKNDLHKKAADQSTTVAALQKSLDTANQNNDFASVGTLQKQLTDERSKLTQLQSDEKQTDLTKQTFDNLVKIAEKRETAIDTNREILISGLKVVDVPGIENLDIIQQTSSRRPSIFLPSSTTP
jgi:hypothetical protein